MSVSQNLLPAEPVERNFLTDPYMKLGAASVAGLVRFAIAEGLYRRNTLAQGSSGRPATNPIPA